MAATEHFWTLIVLQMTVFCVVISKQTDNFDTQLIHVNLPIRHTSNNMIYKIKSKLMTSVGPERRIFSPFNRLIFSMMAPRLMRFQFDMMLSTIISELVRKFVIPVMGSLANNNNNNEEKDRPNLLSALFQTHTTTTTTQTPFDIKQVMAKTQNAFQNQAINAIQSAIRPTNGLVSATTQPQAMVTNNQNPNSDQINVLAESILQSLPYYLSSVGVTDSSQNNGQTQSAGPMKLTYIQTPKSSKTTSGSPQVIIGQPIPITIANSISSQTTKQNEIQTNEVQTDDQLSKNNANDRPFQLQTFLSNNSNEIIENDAINNINTNTVEDNDMDNNINNNQESSHHYMFNLDIGQSDKNSPNEPSIQHLDNHLDHQMGQQMGQQSNKYANYYLNRDPNKNVQNIEHQRYYDNQLTQHPNDQQYQHNNPEAHLVVQRYGQELSDENNNSGQQIVKTNHKFYEEEERASRWNNVLQNMDFNVNSLSNSKHKKHY